MAGDDSTTGKIPRITDATLMDYGFSPAYVLHTYIYIYIYIHIHTYTYIIIRVYTDSLVYIRLDRIG